MLNFSIWQGRLEGFRGEAPAAGISSVVIGDGAVDGLLV